MSTIKGQHDLLQSIDVSARLSVSTKATCLYEFSEMLH